MNRLDMVPDQIRNASGGRTVLQCFLRCQADEVLSSGITFPTVLPPQKNGFLTGILGSALEYPRMNIPLLFLGLGAKKLHPEICGCHQSTRLMLVGSPGGTR